MHNTAQLSFWLLSHDADDCCVTQDQIRFKDRLFWAEIMHLGPFSFMACAPVPLSPFSASPTLPTPAPRPWHQRCKGRTHT